jgi:hypothetical protein
MRQYAGVGLTPGLASFLASHRASWGILPQATVFSLRSARCHWHSRSEGHGTRISLFDSLPSNLDVRSIRLWSCASDSAPSEARKRGSGGGSPRKHDDVLTGPSDLGCSKDLLLTAREAKGLYKSL